MMALPRTIGDKPGPCVLDNPRWLALTPDWGVRREVAFALTTGRRIHEEYQQERLRVGMRVEFFEWRAIRSFSDFPKPKSVSTRTLSKRKRVRVRSTSRHVRPGPATAKLNRST